MFISLDIGGTYTRIASSDDLKNIIGQEKFETPQEADKLVLALSERIGALAGSDEIKGISIGVPGIVDKKNGRLGTIVNIPSISGFSYTDLLGKKYERTTIVAENDATLAGLAEAVEGAGKAHEVVAYLTLSTGVGGVKISGKKIDPYQKYSEPGHMIIHGGGKHFEKCDQYGCLSAYCSGTAFESIYGESPVTCKDLAIWADYAGNLSLGVINILAVWAPDIIVLGGSMCKKFDEFFKEPLLVQLSKQELFEVPPIVKSQFGDESGIKGGFILLSQKLSKQEVIF